MTLDSPAQRYAAAKKRGRGPNFAAFESTFEFVLDDFQREACLALEKGDSLLVAAPTGAGKTIVGEFAAHLAITNGTKCFYTTPIKALSNQKYAEFCEIYGHQKIGLLTGDSSINGDADVVVMTTEVLRNMIYVRSSALEKLQYVVLDEVHYLSDKFRGPTWEEILIHLSDEVITISLSATVSNIEDFSAWISDVRGRLTTVVSENRPIPLFQHMLLGSKLHNLFDDSKSLNQELARATRNVERYGKNKSERIEIIELLDDEDLLPAISFIFSRAGCEAAVRQVVSAGVSLTTSAERNFIENYIQEKCAGLPVEDLKVIGFAEWRESLLRGVAAHHAGLIPTFKEVVEYLFKEGLIRMVYATETLSLGINMPARSVILERLVKWNGESHVELTPGEYTQLTGRAGRRGIDIEGHAIVLWGTEHDAKYVAGLASTRTYPLNSAFKPTYNMVANLIERLGYDAALDSVSQSFAQWQADESVVSLSKALSRNDKEIRKLSSEIECHMGNFDSYFDLRIQIRDRERSQKRDAKVEVRNRIQEVFDLSQPGDVIWIQRSRRSVHAVVIDCKKVGDFVNPLIFTSERKTMRVNAFDLTTVPFRVGRTNFPKDFDLRSSKSRKYLSKVLISESWQVPKNRVSIQDDLQDLDSIRTQMKSHPCHGCPDRELHSRVAERRERLIRDNAQIHRQISQSTNVISREFDQVSSVLTERGHLNDRRPTSSGEILRRIYSDFDLLLVEILCSSILSDSDPSELAAILTLFTYEDRKDDRIIPKIPSERLKRTTLAIAEVQSQISESERRFNIFQSRALDAGFMDSMYQWANGATLEKSLRLTDLSPGDFVRGVNQVIDLLGQIADLKLPISANAQVAIGRIRRGVVANVVIS